MNEKDHKEINRFVNEVVSRYKENIILIILFGSATRDRLTEESDIDFLIITSGNRLDLLKKITRIATPIVLEYGRPISTKVYDINQYEYLKNLQTPFMESIKEEGEILWMRK